MYHNLIFFVHYVKQDRIQWVRSRGRWSGGTGTLRHGTLPHTPVPTTRSRTVDVPQTNTSTFDGENPIQCSRDGHGRVRSPPDVLFS